MYGFVSWERVYVYTHHMKHCAFNVCIYHKLIQQAYFVGKKLFPNTLSGLWACSGVNFQFPIFHGIWLRVYNHHGGNNCNYGTTRLKILCEFLFRKAKSIPYIPYSESTPGMGVWIYWLPGGPFLPCFGDGFMSLIWGAGFLAQDSSKSWICLRLKHIPEMVV